MARKQYNKRGIQTIEQATKDFLKQSRTKLKESTFSRYNFICERHILPYFKGIELDKLNAEIIHKFAQDKLMTADCSASQFHPKP